MPAINSLYKYHWPSQRAIIALLAIAIATPGFYAGHAQGLDTTQRAAAIGIISGGIWLLCESLCSIIEMYKCNGYRLHRMCVFADSMRPTFLTVVAACNLVYAADILFERAPHMMGVVFLHIIHAVVFIYILIIDWHIDNTKKLERSRYRKRG